MNLREWLDQEKISQRDFAARFDPQVSQGLVSQWLLWVAGKGGKRITAERAIEIEKITLGAVPREESRPDIFAREVA